MNCPYCAKEMESGYLRGGSGYELLWTEEPFKMTSLPTGNDFFVCKASDVYRPIAHLCRTCGKIVLDIKKKETAADLSTRGAFRKNLSHSIRRTAANRTAHPAAFAAYGGKQAPALRAAFSAPQAENRPSALQLTQRLTS